MQAHSFIHGNNMSIKAKLLGKTSKHPGLLGSGYGTNYPGFQLTPGFSAPGDFSYFLENSAIFFIVYPPFHRLYSWP